MKNKRYSEAHPNLSSIFGFLTPIIYLLVWYAIPLQLFGKDGLDTEKLILLALPVLFIGLISKQTTWNIGGTFGLSGDNGAKVISGHLERRGGFEIKGYEDNEDMQTLAAAVITAIQTNKPLPKQSQSED